MPDAVMLFAAGFGTRMGALTADRPKPLIPVAGRPLIDHALALVDAYGSIRRVANAHYHAGQISAHLADKNVIVSPELPDILDTGGGLRAAMPLLNTNPVFTLNTDAIWSGPNPLRLLANAWDPGHMDALLLCVPLSRAVGRQGAGDFRRAPDGQLTRTGDLVYTGAQIVKTDGLAAIPDHVFSLNVLWNRLAERGRLCGIEYPGTWCDVGRPDGIALAEQLLDQTDV